MLQNRSNCLCFESFLQKRKDTMKLRWVTYWFRLQNTTLFFYTQKHGNASHLRGHYYIYTVQSVREVHNDDSKRFMFEIIMTSGKRKMLAADSAALRQDWVRKLWQAMHLSSSGAGIVRSRNQEASQQNARGNTSSEVERLNSNIYSDVERVVKNNDSCRPPVPEPTSEEPIYQNTVFQHARVNEDVSQEGVYDVLPSRKNLQPAEPSSDTDNGEYESPISYRTATDQESPYDVPSALLRKLPDSSIDDEDSLYWKI